MFGSEKKLTQSRHSLTVMATCVKVSDHSYSALEQAVLFWAIASSRLHSPFGSSSFCTRESSACGAGGFLGGREKLLMFQMSLEKEWKKNLIKAEAEQFGHFPWGLYGPAPLLQSDTSALAPSLGGSREARGEKYTAAQPPPKAVRMKDMLIFSF